MTNETLKRKRTEAGVSRKAAADACGISQFRLDRIERGVADAEQVKSYATQFEHLLKGGTLAKVEPPKPKASNGGGTKPATKTTTKAPATKAPAKKATTKPAAKKATPAQPKPEADKS
jgi:predicted transcriptional regulator